MGVSQASGWDPAAAQSGLLHGGSRYRSGELTLIFDRVTGGLGSSYLSQMKPGEELALSGPFGNFVLPPSLDRELILIARYTGLVPIRCMLEELYAQRYRVPFS